jgi:hypothetical protein
MIARCLGPPTARNADVEQPGQLARAVGRDHGKDAPKGPSMDELLQLEHAGWASLCDGTGADFYGATMTDDAVMVLANGSVMTRTEVIAALGTSPPWASYEMDDPRVVSIGDNSTALIYVGTGHRSDDEPPFVGVMTSVYVRREGAWKLAVYQQTPVS